MGQGCCTNRDGKPMVEVNVTKEDLIPTRETWQKLGTKAKEAGIKGFQAAKAHDYSATWQKVKDKTEELK